MCTGRPNFASAHQVAPFNGVSEVAPPAKVGEWSSDTESDNDVGRALRPLQTPAHDVHADGVRSRRFEESDLEFPTQPSQASAQGRNDGELSSKKMQVNAAMGRQSQSATQQMLSHTTFSRNHSHHHQQRGVQAAALARKKRVATASLVSRYKQEQKLEKQRQRQAARAAFRQSVNKRAAQAAAARLKPSVARKPRSSPHERRRSASPHQWGRQTQKQPNAQATGTSTPSNIPATSVYVPKKSRIRHAPAFVEGKNGPGTATHLGVQGSTIRGTSRPSSRSRLNKAGSHHATQQGQEMPAQNQNGVSDGTSHTDSITAGNMVHVRPSVRECATAKAALEAVEILNVAAKAGKDSWIRNCEQKPQTTNQSFVARLKLSAQIRLPQRPSTSNARSPTSSEDTVKVDRLEEEGTALPTQKDMDSYDSRRSHTVGSRRSLHSERRPQTAPGTRRLSAGSHKHAGAAFRFSPKTVKPCKPRRQMSFKKVLSHPNTTGTRGDSAKGNTWGKCGSNAQMFTFARNARFTSQPEISEEEAKARAIARRQGIWMERLL